MIVTIDRKPEFNNCVQHPLQSWQWGDFKSQQAFNAVRLARVNNENQIIESDVLIENDLISKIGKNISEIEFARV